MIKRLESAGLGFFVHATETQQKLGSVCLIVLHCWVIVQIISPGKIPLRQLVYRVLDLPPSMRPLVYDFGQLNTDTESDYIRQIVSDHVSACVKPAATNYIIIDTSLCLSTIFSAYFADGFNTIKARKLGG